MKQEGVFPLPNYHVEFFEAESGAVPAEEFIDSLDMKMSAKIYRLLGMIERNGPELREPYSKHLDDGIFGCARYSAPTLPAYSISFSSASGLLSRTGL